MDKFVRPDPSADLMNALGGEPSPLVQAQNNQAPNNPPPAPGISPMGELTKKSRWEKVGHALMGFGAGLQGEGMEFLASQEILSDKRKSAAAKDLYRTRTMLSEDVEAAKLKGLKPGTEAFRGFVSRRASDFLANKRRPQIFRLGGKSDETDALVGLVQSNPVAAIKNIDEDLSIARAAGLAPSPKVEFEGGYIFTQDPYDPEKISLQMAPGYTGNMTGKMKDYLASAADPEFAQFLENQKQSFNIRTGESIRDKIAGQALTEIREQAKAAEEQQYYLQRMMDLPVDDLTGSLTGLRANLVNLANWGGERGMFVGLAEDLTGLSADDAADLGKYNAIGQKMLNEMLNLAKGPQTEGDAQRAAKTVPQITNQAAVNKFIIDTMYGLHDLAVRKADFVGSVLDQQETDGERINVYKAEKAWRKFARENPLMSSHQNEDGTRKLFWRFAKTIRENAAANNEMVTDEQIYGAWRRAQRVK